MGGDAINREPHHTWYHLIAYSDTPINTCKECRYVRENAAVNPCPMCQSREPGTQIRTEWVRRKISKKDSEVRPVTLKAPSPVPKRHKVPTRAQNDILKSGPCSKCKGTGLIKGKYGPGWKCGDCDTVPKEPASGWKRHDDLFKGRYV